MNKIQLLFSNKKNILSLYYTAGYPRTNSTIEILDELMSPQGADMIEIGVPFSDPLADGPLIQQAHSVALSNGMNLKLLLEQLEKRQQQIKHASTPVILMSYLNPIYRFGIETFCHHASSVGISAVIIPDLPPYLYEEKYKPIFEKYSLGIIFLVTPQTDDVRIRRIDKLSGGFLYAVSYSSTTGNEKAFGEYTLNYLKRLHSLKLKNPVMVGFGISTRESFRNACKYANGAIVGTAFIKCLTKKNNIKQFIKSFR